ncbi:MAG: hypothetical protein DMF62_03570 [Acidobacteria bacterium]|nr:MAG: hypothetical protein DMF62_03570 [Acidobacteriota bacterium]
MPITQERMIALCTEGLAQRQAFVRLRDEISTTLAAHRMDTLMAITLIEGIIATSQLPPADNLIAESVHWRYRRGANEKNRDRMRRKRATQPHPINAPTSVIRPLTDSDLENLNLDEEFARWNRGESHD